MVAPNARDFLKKENELLDELANRAAAFANKATGLEADIYNAAARFSPASREQ